MSFLRNGEGAGAKGFSTDDTRRLTVTLTVTAGCFYWDNERVKVRGTDDGFRIGCTFVSWATWDALKVAVEAGR